MGKRKRVPEKLHFELTEYSSLLRALRTSSALDVTTQLTRPPPNHWQDDDTQLGSDLDDDDEEEDASPIGSNIPNTSSTPIAGPSDLNHPSNRAFSQGPPANTSQETKRKPKTKPPPRKQRDTWTRWPLLMGDVMAPEWNLEDEITLLAAQALKRHPPTLLPVFPDDDDPPAEQRQASQNKEDEALDLHSDEDDLEHPSYIPYLVSSATECLAYILDIMATHTPARAPSLQNRIEPIHWQSILNALAARGNTRFMDAQIMQNVSSRLRAVYGEPDKPDHGVHRIQIIAAAKKKLSDLMTAAEASIFEPPPGPIKTRRHKEIGSRVPPKGRSRGSDEEFNKKNWTWKKRKGKGPETPEDDDNDEWMDDPRGATLAKSPPRRSKRKREIVNYVPQELDDSLHEKGGATASLPPLPTRKRRAKKANIVGDVPMELDDTPHKGGEGVDGLTPGEATVSLTPPAKRKRRKKLVVKAAVEVPMELDEPPHEEDSVHGGPEEATSPATSVAKGKRRKKSVVNAPVSSPMELDDPPHEEDSVHDGPGEATSPATPVQRKRTRRKVDPVVDVPSKPDDPQEEGSDGEVTEVESANASSRESTTPPPPPRRSTRARGTVNYVVDVPLDLQI